MGCQPQPQGYGYGHQGYGHNYCKEVAQETCYNVPVVTVVEPAVDVTYPEPIKTCVNKPISVPEVEDVTEAAEKCVTGLTDPACQGVELTLPKQVCVEINYGYAADTAKHEEPAYAPAPAPAYPHA